MQRASGLRTPSRTRKLSPNGESAPNGPQHQQQQQVNIDQPQPEGFMGQQLERPASAATAAATSSKQQRQGTEAARRLAYTTGSRRKPETPTSNADGLTSSMRQGGSKQKARQATCTTVANNTANFSMDQQQQQEIRQHYLRHANSEQLGPSNSDGSIHTSTITMNNLETFQSTNNGPSNKSSRQQAKQQQHQDPGCARSQSALAGSTTMTALPTNSTTAGTVGLATYTTNSLRPKTTRVRINSTSEQIQDPNWLIKMSKELEQPQEKKSHLRSLQRKLKSTISGASGQSGSSSSRNQQQQQQASQHLEDPSLALPPSKPTTPIKVPVSILKQRSGPKPASAHLNRQAPVPQTQQAPARQPRSAGGRLRNHAAQQTTPAQTAPPHSASLSSSSSPQNPSQQQQPFPTKLIESLNFSSPATNPSSSQKLVSASSSAPVTSATSHSATATGQTTNRPEPICAEGQVKVSGWRRNNLLAKTLSHLDEIRGNQRPVFVPTKIRLPSTEGSSSSSGLARSASPSSSRFADIVREAMVSKRDLMGQQATKRTSDGECKEPKETAAAVAGGSGNNLEITRAVSADPTSGCQLSSSDNPTTSGHPQMSGGQHHHQHHHQQPRSSSAGLTGGGNKQQVIVSLNWAGQMSKHNGNNSSANSPNTQSPIQRVPVTAVATPHLMNQLLSVSAHQSSQLLESGSSSTRQFKLQHKNHQVLQNLRRQSNELQASLNAAALKAAAEEATGNSAGASPNGAGSGRTKDWKRLASKLGLLAGGKHTLGIPRSPLGSLGGDSLANQMPLRLTVSNQETGDHRIVQKRGSGQHQQGLMVPGQPRKLSSSSMIVEPATRRGPTRRSNSPRLSDFELVPQAGVIPRRSSDSEAYRVPKATGIGLEKESVNVVDGSNISPSSEPFEPEKRSQPVVVHRDDLLQLLQVTGSGNSVQQPSGGRVRRSLQLTVDPLLATEGEQVARYAVSDTGNGERRSDFDEHNGSDCSATTRSWCEGAGLEHEAIRNRRSNSVKSMDGLIIGEDEVAIDPTAQLKVQKEEIEVANTGKRRTDLSWVVKKTSKVVFFHQKLRKIRWHMKQSSKSQQEQASNESKEMARQQEVATSQESTATLSGSENKSNPSKGAPLTAGTGGRGGEEVFMDPTLIGDAIEIFLRSTMHQTGLKSSPGEEPGVTMRQHSGASSESVVSDKHNNILEGSIAATTNEQ